MNFSSLIKFKLICFLLLPGLQACTSSKYIIERNSELATLDLDNSIVNYIPLQDESISKSKILDSTFNLIVKKKFSRLNKYINSLENESSEKYLSQTFLMISKKEYIPASISLKQVTSHDYVLQRRLLSIDLDYEITRATGRQNFNEILKRYQDLVDAYPDEISLKKIVAIRLRYLRYNY